MTIKKILPTVLFFQLLVSVALAGDKPNVILFFVDDLGWNSLGYRSPDLFETPNIDRLASDSVDFQQAYVASPTCSPSRATLLTGKHPARLKMVRHTMAREGKGAEVIFDSQGRASHHLLKTDPAQFPSKNWVDLEEVTYAEALKKLGYYNLFVGKWHLGPQEFHPIHQGFDKQIGTTDRGSPSNYYPDYFKDSNVLEVEKEEPQTYLTDRLTDEVVKFIETHDRKQPFMVSFWYYNVHTPNIGRKDLLKRFEGKPGLEGKRAKYAAQVMAIDESVGRVRAALKSSGLEDDTVIIFTSDQGSLFEWEPYRGGKRVDTLCEGGARVPLLVSWPGVSKPKTTNDNIVQTTDLFPTLVELAGGVPADFKNLDGISLLSTITNGDVLSRGKPVFGYRAYQDLYASVREGDWKLLGYRSGKVGLYNVVKDRSEKHDVAETNPKKVDDLLSKLKSWEQEMGVEMYSGF